jgi:hypothetical protein
MSREVKSYWGGGKRRAGIDDYVLSALASILDDLVDSIFRHVDFALIEYTSVSGREFCIWSRLRMARPNMCARIL